MQARRQPRRQGSLAGAERHVWGTRTGRGRAQDERPVQLLALERRPRDLQCNSAEQSADFMMKLDTI